MTDKRSLLDKDKPRVTQLNKRAVIIVAVVILVLLFYIVVTAFSNAAKRRQAQSTINTKIAAQSANSSDQNHALEKLPDGYEDAHQIDQLLGRHKPVQTMLPDSIKRELEKLRSQQNSLQSQLQSLRAQRQTPVSHQTEYDRQAASSPIFFAGGAPQPESQKQLNHSQKQDTNKNDKSHNKQSAKGDSYSNQNMQNQKLSFMSGKVNKDIYNKNGVQYPVSKYELQAGTVIPAILQTQIISNNPGVIVARVSRNVYDFINGQYLLIPKDSRLIGEYNSKIAYGQYQIQAKFVRLIRPDGSSVVLPNQPATNSMGVSGMEDEVNNHWGRIIGAAALSALFSIPAIIATNQMNNSYTSTCSGGTCVASPNLSSTATASALQGVGQIASNVGSKLAERSLNIQPTITIHAGYQFSVLVSKDTVLPPYHESMESIPELRSAQ